MRCGTLGSKVRAWASERDDNDQFSPWSVERYAWLPATRMAPSGRGSAARRIHSVRGPVDVQALTPAVAYSLAAPASSVNTATHASPYRCAKHVADRKSACMNCSRTEID